MLLLLPAQIGTVDLNNAMQFNAILTSLSLSLELSASLGATDDVVNRSDALPLSSDVPGSFAIVIEFCKKNKKKTTTNY